MQKKRRKRRRKRKKRKRTRKRKRIAPPQSSADQVPKQRQVASPVFSPKLFLLKAKEDPNKRKRKRKRKKPLLLKLALLQAALPQAAA